MMRGTYQINDTPPTDHRSTYGPSSGNTASSSEADSIGETLLPPRAEPTPIVVEPNRWCMDGQYYIYQSAHTLPINTSEYDYKMGIILSGAFQRDAEQRVTLLRWITRHIAEDMERTEWVRTPTLGIRKATLSFAAKFFRLNIQTRLSLTQVDNVVTRDQAVMLAAIMAGLQIDFFRILIAEIHKRAFKTTTTLPFPCLIFHLCRECSVSIWHCDRLLEVNRTIDIGLIKDETNLDAPQRETQVTVPPLGDDLTAFVEQMQVDDTTIPALTIDAQAPPSRTTIQAPPEPFPLQGPPPFL
uniref:Integrase core domain containing protein n=1 Tax=Solanum tuberosum TaxID=4113 RepID=M1DIX6_SOLTU